MITIWLAIKAYLIAKAPEYVKDVVESFVTDGIKAGLKRLFGGKKKEPVLDAVNTLDAKMDYLISLSKSNSNATIREIAQQLNGLIYARPMTCCLSYASIFQRVINIHFL